ncbi:MAG: amino acid adenylation domain-containing protein, partial [bacterium]|nr:amino acid adenylation domain-containing protein [bacterium]
QDLPFEKLVEELNPQRDLSRTPLFQVMLVLQNAHSSSVDLPELTLTPIATDRGTARFDLLLALADAGDELVGSIEYATDLFDASTIVRLWGHLGTLLGAAATDPERPSSELALLSPAEHRQIVAEWNERPVPEGRHHTLHELFAAQVERTPDAVALIDGDERLSYRELNRRADRLGRHLRRLGVGPEVLVAICMRRSSSLVVAILGVLKAGGAYVPLDPAYPEERLAFMREDSGAAVVLTDDNLRFPTLADPAGNVCNPDNLAYVIYTSGSTGRAKGVAIAHRNAAALVHWARQAFPAAQLAGMLASTSICFDLSIFEIFVPLSTGGKVILAENALALPSLPAADEVTTINTVPSAMTELLRLGAVPASAATVNLAGEALPRPLVEKLYALGTVERVWNLYGPSEDTTYTTGAVIPRGRGVVPIGRPVANGDAWVLDRRLQPLPVGVPGEVYVGGPGLVRGYLRRPALTAERFVPHPFGQTGSRRYRTGDLARYLPDGNLDYPGRLDFQVKIRGFRIELGEIESTLRAHPDLREVAVIARADGPEGERRLVTFVVAGEGHTLPPVDELRAFVGRTLPAAMVPALFVELPALPLLPNGKVDRKELGRRPIEALRTAAAAAPRDGLEIALVGIWEELLDVRPIGVRDNFFELGGHSLAAVRLLAVIVERLGRELPLTAL